MVRFERKDTNRARLAIASLAKEKAKRSGTYNTPEVNAALQEMFHHKCYLCEKGNLTNGYQIEHLQPHKGDKDLKFDWSNLFLSCSHCNNIKLGKYDPILDCSQIPIDRKISFRKTGYFGVREDVEFLPLEDDVETQNTADLLQAVFHGETFQKQIEARSLRKKLRSELSTFKNLLRDYREEDDETVKQKILRAIQDELENSSEFTAFKRWIIWDYADQYPEIAAYLDTLLSSD